MQDKPYYFLKSESVFSKIRRPAFCCIGVSAMCTLRCKMCFTWKNKYVKSPEEPLLDEWYSFIDRLADLTDNCVEINVAGGEPLLDERNLALVGFSAKKGLSTSMPSSGYLIDKDMAYKIADSGLDAIGISLDGINKNTHDFLRGVPGCYDRAMQAVNHLDKYSGNIQISIITTISKVNLDEIVKIAEWVNSDNRIENIIFQAISQPFGLSFDNEWYKSHEYDFLWPQGIKKVHDTIDELIKLKNKGYKISNSVSQLDSFKKYFKKPEDFIKKGECNVNFYMNINQEGDVFLCVHKKPIGNIKKDAPATLWYSSKANLLREYIKNCKRNCHHLINCCYEE